MGLGKTVQTIATILKRPLSKTEKKAGYCKATLQVQPPVCMPCPRIVDFNDISRDRIVTPLSVMDQWVKEVKAKTLPGRLSVCSYHGPQKGKLANLLHTYDVVVSFFRCF